MVNLTALPAVIEYGAPVENIVLHHPSARPSVQVKHLASIGDTILVGYATCYNKAHTHKGRIEVFAKGAFGESLKSPRSVAFLYGHSWANNHGSTTDGRLHLFEDNVGLAFALRPSDSEAGRKLVGDVRAGRLRMSVGYEVEHQAEREVDGTRVTFVHQALLREISAVPTPAVKETSIAAVSSKSFPGLRAACQSGVMASYAAAATWERCHRRLLDALGS